MLKSSKWAPYEPPREMLRALEERCAGPGMAGGPSCLPCSACHAVHQCCVPGRPLAMAEARLLSQKAFTSRTTLPCL